MRYELPQYIQEEAKIAGPFTIKQFFILFGGILLSTSFFVFFKSKTAIFLSVVLLSTLSILILGKYNGRKLFDVLISALKYAWLPKTYVWKKKTIGAQEVFIEQQKPIIITKPPEKEQEHKIITKEELRQLAKELDKRELGSF